jgi:hypothetical protein
MIGIKSGLQKSYSTSTPKYFSAFRFTKSNGLGLLNLKTQSYNTAKSWRLCSGWHNVVRTWNLKSIAVITWNVANKQCRLLQVLVSALLLVSCTNFGKRYPHPVDRHKYHLRIDDGIYSLVCPKNLTFDQDIEKCTFTTDSTLYISWVPDKHCGQHKHGYYCNSEYSFTYCTHDNMEIIGNETCPSGKECRDEETEPCWPQ